MDEARPIVVGWRRGQLGLAALVAWAAGGWLVPLALAVTVAGDPQTALGVMAWAMLAAAALCVPLLNEEWEERGDQGA